MTGTGNIKVVVRCRPLNNKELARGATSLVRMEGNQTMVTQPATASTHINSGNSNSVSRSHRDSHGNSGSNNNANSMNSDDIKAFTFDRSFWSLDPASPNYASQEIVYQDLGQELLDHAFDGYNCCIFAYGQTGSGKSYTMMGYGEDKGIIPRTCEELFSRITSATNAISSYQVEVSYMEIYNEKVRDLLNPRKSSLRIREHQSLGPYVEDLSRLAVKSFADIDHLMNEGNKARTVAATNMNETSSRSHAVFTIFLTSKKLSESSKVVTEKVSRISLVDLAGSERADSTGATGARLKEGANINRSLTTLGKVIAGLAEQSTAESKKGSKKHKEVFIPYRDSVLTWLLKDSLGGNSKTAMIAAISPADYDETLSTLRYADQAKKIKNKAVVNEDPNAKLIRELKEELQALRDTLMAYAPEQVERISSHTNPSVLGSKSTPRLGTLSPSPKPLATTSTISISGASTSSIATTPTTTMPAATTATANATATTTAPATPVKEISFSDAFGATRKLTMTEMVDQLKASQKLLDQVNQTWEEKLVKTQEVHLEREKALEALGILLEKDNGMGIHTPKQTPHLVNLNEDPLMSECLVYQLKPGTTRVGRFESDNADIRLSGPNIMDYHCHFENENGTVTIFPTMGSMTMVNGLSIMEKKQLHNGYRIILGDYHVFRFNHPEEVRKERDRLSSDQLPISASSFGITSSGRSSRMTERSDSPAFLFSDRDSSYSGGPPDIVDWNFAKREAVLNYYHNNNNDISYMSGNNNGGSLDLSKRFSLIDDENMSRTTSSSIRFSNGSLPLSIGMINDEDNFRRNNRHSGSLSIDTGVFSSTEGLDMMDTMSEDFDSASGIIKRENAQLQLKRQKEEYEERIRQATLSHMQSSDIHDIEVKLQHVIDEMQRTMDRQKQAYESKIKRLSSKLPSDMQKSPLSPLYSPTELKLVSKAIAQWKTQRYVLMAEAILIHSIVLKEANIIAKDLGKNVSYQFIVVQDDTVISSRSFWEATSSRANINSSSNDEDLDSDSDSDTDIQHANKPCIAVQVIDMNNRVTYIWSIQKTKRRLKKMQSLYNFTEQPLSRAQVVWRDPFYQSPCYRYTLIGLARIPLHNLALQVSMESLVDIFDCNTAQVIGKLRLVITPILRSASNTGDYKTSERSSVSYNSPSSGSNQAANIPSLADSLLSSDCRGESPSTKYATDTNYGDSICQRYVCQQQIFEVCLIEISGISEKWFTQVHAQFRLSSFGNVSRYSDDDKIYATEPVSEFQCGPIQLNYTQTLTATITADMLHSITTGHLTVEIYGQAQSAFLSNVIERNLAREKETEITTENNGDHLTRNSDSLLPARIDLTKAKIDDDESASSVTTEQTSFSYTSTPAVCSPTPTSTPFSSPVPGRRLKMKTPIRSYTDDGLLLKERHHVVAWVQFYELGDDGDYCPVNVVAYSPQDQGCFYLRQGIQRRIRITMVHDSGLRLPWKNVTSVNISNVLLSSDNSSNDQQMSQESKILMQQSVPITLHQDQPLEYNRDGTSVLVAQGHWDNSLHDFVHLNRITPPQQRIVSTLSWQVTCDKCTQPLSFSMDIAMKIHSRELAPPNNANSSGSSAILHYFSSAFYQYHHMSKKLRGIFSVRLSPPLTRQVSQLWRVNSANRYVRGEEILGPEGSLRGISLVEDYRKARKQMIQRQQVLDTQHALSLLELQRRKYDRQTMQDQLQQDNCATVSTENLTGLLYKIIQLWTSKFGTQEEIVIHQKPPTSPSVSSSVSSPENAQTRYPTKDITYLKLAPQIRYMQPSDTVSKKGYLKHPQTNESELWVKHWFTIRRPFMIVYQDQTEIDELAVIDLTSVRVEHRKDLEDLIQKPNAFAIYTTNNAYLFQAKDIEDMIGWITTVDQFYPVDTL